MSRHVPRLALLLVAGAVRVAVAQDPGMDPLFRLDGRSRAQIEALIDSARQANLPWEKVRLQALQGLSKRVDGPTIVTAVRRYYAGLSKAREVLGPMGPTELDAGAAALTAGLRPEELALFRSSVGGRSPAGALVYLSALIGAKNGVPHDDAVIAFAKLWKDGAADADFYGLWHGIDQDILSGMNPRVALQQQVRRLPARSNRPPTDQENPRS